ncbi:hypothetical protein BN1723_005987 [Verticillium longisporum]|uniref:Glycolipid transfer protein domain-containing protein n=1 Tax=Verticillium longisporum TaxID=100787 RepID=A0A0G4NCN4_VERLO|nr:hypothetical protein BN1723_005987 [Verticillium longisporum]
MAVISNAPKTAAQERIELAFENRWKTLKSNPKIIVIALFASFGGFEYGYQQDVLGSVAFSPVKSDMLGNVKKIRDRLLAAPAESLDLQSLVRAEIASKKHVAAEGLLWLTRPSPLEP